MAEDTTQKNQGWEEADDGGFVTFEEEGDSITGVLRGYKDVTTSNGPAKQYEILTSQGLQNFYGKTDLDKKLPGILIKYGEGNALIKITLKEIQKTNNKNTFKLFTVLHRQKDSEQLKELGIDEYEAEELKDF